MKRFKTFFPALILALIFTPLIQSCLDDNDNHYLVIATFRITDNEQPYFVLDEGETMYPENGVYAKLEEGQRVYVIFDIISENTNGYDYQITVQGIEKILTKETFVMTAETADSIGDDRIDITNMWFGDDYLNIKFRYKGTRNSSKPHMVNLIYNNVEVDNKTTLEDDYINLEFRHNSYEDKGEDVLDGIVSFKGPFTKDEYKGLNIRYRSIYEDIQYKNIDFKKESNEKKSDIHISQMADVSIAH